MADPISVEQNLENGVVPNIPAHNRSFYMAFFQMRRPVTSAELNHIQQIQRDAIGRTAATFAQQGWAFWSDYTTNWQAIDQAGQNAAETTSLVMTLGRSSALVYDMPMEVGSRNGNGDLTIDLGTAPVSGVQKDFVFAEFWNASVGGFGTDASDQDVFTYGRINGGTEHNDILQSDIVDVETARRIQSRWRIRVVPDVSFFANPNGFSSPIVTAQGENDSPLANYTFIDLGATPTEDGPARQELSGLWRAGVAANSQANALGTTDGYVYALPMFIVTRTASVSQPDIADIRQLTNGNLVGVFEFLAPCTLIVKADSILYYDCNKLTQLARLTHGSSPLNPSLVSDQMGGIFAARQLQSTAPGPLTNGPNDIGTPPLIVNSTTMVPNLNSNYLQGAIPGTSAGNILLLDAKGNAVVGGTSLSLAAYTGVNGLLDNVNMINTNGDAWITDNARWDNDLQTWFPQNGNYPSGAMQIQRLTGIASFNYVDAQQTTITWNPVLTLDKRNNLSTLTTNFVMPTGKMAIGQSQVTHALDVTGTVNILGNTATAPLIVTTSASSDGIQVVGNGGVGTKGVNVSSTAGDAVYATGGTGSAVHSINTGSGFSLYAQGAKSVFMPVDGGSLVRVGINNSNPLWELDVVGRIKTTTLQVYDPNNPPALGYYLSAINIDGTASWAKLPTGPIPAAMGTPNYLSKWTDSSNDLGVAQMVELTPGFIAVGMGSVNSIASISTSHAVMVGANTVTQIPDIVSDNPSVSTHPLAAGGSIIFGAALGSTSKGTEAIFSNKAVPDSTYSNMSGLSFMTQSHVRMILTKSGNVAIGKPANTLANFGGATNLDDTTIHAPLEVYGQIGMGPGIAGNARMDYPYLTIATDPNAGNRRGGVQFMRGSQRIFALGVDRGIDGNPGSNGGYSNFFITQHSGTVAGNDTVFGTPLTRFMIGSNGNTGINTGDAVPIYPLQVGGDIGNAGSLFVNGSGDGTVAPHITLFRNNLNDKNSSIIFNALGASNSVNTMFTLGTVDSSVTGTGAYTSTAMYLNDTNGTRLFIDTYGKQMTVNGGSAGNPGTGSFNIASNSGVTLAGIASSPVFTANYGTLDTTVGYRTLGSFGVQTADSGSVRNVSLGIHAYRLATSASVDNTAVGIGYDMQDTVGYNSSGIWLYSNGNVSVGSTPSVDIRNRNLAFYASGNVGFGQGLDVVGAFTGHSNIHSFGAGTIGIQDATHPYLNISAPTIVGGSIRSGIGLYHNATLQWLLANDINNDGTQNFFLYDGIHATYPMMIDSRGYMGLGQSPSATFGANLDVAGTGIVTTGIGIGSGAYPAQANNSSAAGVLSVRGPSLFTGISPTPVVMTVGMGSYGVSITTGTVGSVNNLTPFFVNATNTGTSTYAAVIQNTSLGRGLSITAPVGQHALDVVTGDTTLGGAFSATGTGTFVGDVVVGGGINITGFTSTTAPDDYSLQAAQNVFLAQNTYMQGFLNVQGLSSFYGEASFGKDIHLWNAASAYVTGNVIVSGETGTNNLYVIGDAIMQHSIRLKGGGGRLYTMLGEYAGHNIGEYIFIHPTNRHTVILRPKRFTGLTIGNDWYEILGDIVPTSISTGLPMDLAGAGTGAWELVAYPAAPVVVNGITVQQIGLTWLPMGYTASYTSLHGYYSDQGEANRRVLASFWHTDAATSDNPAGGLILFSKDTQDLDFFDSSQIGIRIREWDTSGRNNGFSWAQNHPARPKPDHDMFGQGAYIGEIWEDYIRREGDNRLDHFPDWLWDRDNDEDWRDGDDEHRNIICDPVDQWLNLSPGAPFPEYTFYTVRPMFVQFNWHVDVAIAAKANVAVDCSWNLHMAHGALTIGGLGAETLGAVQTYGWPLAEGDPGTGQTELVAMHHRFINGTRGVPISSHATNFYYIPAGVHVLRQRIHLDGPFVRANMTRSFLQMIMWGADQNPPFLSTTISSPSPPPPPPPPPPHGPPPCKKPLPCQEFRAYVVTPDRHGCSFRGPDDFGDDDNYGYDVEWRGYSHVADPDTDPWDHHDIIDCGKTPSCERKDVEDEHSYYRCRPRNTCEDGDWSEWLYCHRWHFSPFGFNEDLLDGHH